MTTYEITAETTRFQPLRHDGTTYLTAVLPGIHDLPPNSRVVVTIQEEPDVGNQPL